MPVVVFYICRLMAHLCKRAAGKVWPNKTALTIVSAVLLTGSYLSSQAVSNQVLSAYVGLTTVFGMGTGGSPQLSPPDILDNRNS